MRDASTEKHQELEPLIKMMNKMKMKKSNASRAKRASAMKHSSVIPSEGEGPRVFLSASGLRRCTSGAIRKGIAADPDAHATDAAFWKSAQVVLPTPKELVTMRLDADLLRWFRRERGYQTRINAILRAYMQAHES
jgi:uncharacterized protein (DUF4415 family)